ncbi:acyltransferase [Pseudoalteromonas sp. D48-MNA-CIBAN-0056]|uniref:acyltransferase family protein n=1 Tax=Pseudoalteromonas sp. D48-MNA-CIBAN-0056 TaxID=3140417 RepID=UPI003318760F
MQMISWVSKQLEISHGTNTPLQAMEGLRGIAVFLVFLVHYSSLISPWLSYDTIHIASFIHSAGQIGVDLFFVLSGFLIYGTIINKLSFDVITYARRRISRIYPTFLFVFSIYIFLSFIFPSESKLPQELKLLVIYVIQNLMLLPGLFDIDPIIAVAWSLSYEVFYYIFIPIIIFATNMKSWKSSHRINFWLLITLFGFTWFYINDGNVRLMMFICGILLYEFNKIQKVTSRKIGTIAFIAAMLFFGSRALADINYHLSIAVIYVLFFIFCLNAFSSDSFSSKWLVNKCLRKLGNMSYSYYLIHGLTLKFSFLVFSVFFEKNPIYDFLYFWLWIPLFCLTLITSFVLFVIIEKPISLKKNI